MIDYYNYDTSPRKIEPTFEDTSVKETKQVKNENKIRAKKQQQSKAKQTKKNLTNIFYLFTGFAILLTISYRYAVINSSFTEKESLKGELAELQKSNQQLKVSIEQGTNINNIEQEAKEKLGMQKLDNNQKVYINLDKSDYVESSIDIQSEDELETWWSKLLKDIFNIR